MKIGKVLFSSIAFILLSAMGCFACDCLTLFEAQSFEKADVVLIGGVTRMEARPRKTETPPRGSTGPSISLLIAPRM